MRACLVWTETVPLSRITVRYERYARGFRALGWEPITVCLREAADDYEESVVIAPTGAALRDPNFYRALGVDAALVVTWLRYPDVVAALKAACPWVVSVGDSDGRISPQIYPRSTLVQSVIQHQGWVDQARATKFWAQRYLLGEGQTTRDQLDSAARADLIALNSPGARDHLAAFFRYHRRPDLASKVAVIPYPVDECYLVGVVPSERARRMVAIGRWDDPQKDAPLMASAIRLALAADPTLGFDLVGPGGQDEFAALARRYPQVVYHGRQTPESVVGLLRNARSLVLSSRWESGPIVANEALSMGCTLVGPVDIPTLEAFCQVGRYGTVCRRRSPADLAAAISVEMRAWDEDRRDPTAVAASWRPRFDPGSVCRQILESTDLLWE